MGVSAYLFQEENITYNFQQKSPVLDVRSFKGVRIIYDAIQSTQTIFGTYFSDPAGLQILAFFPIVVRHQQEASVYLPNLGPFMQLSFSNQQFVQNAIRSTIVYGSNVDKYPCTSKEIGAARNVPISLPGNSTFTEDLAAWFTGPAHIVFETTNREGTVEVQVQSSTQASTQLPIFDRVFGHSQEKKLLTTHSFYIPPAPVRLVCHNTTGANADYNIALVFDSYYL